MDSRPTPALLLVSPPLTGGTSCILREAGERQQWERVTLDAPQLDYFNLDKLQPGWQVWAHEGRYLSDHTLRHLNWLMCPPGPQPAPVEAPDELESVLACLKRQRLALHQEKATQQQLADLFDAAGLYYAREVRLSDRSIIDFCVGGLGIEVKLTGAAKSIAKQCLRYCEFPAIERLLILTNKQLGLPATLAGKPAHLFSLGQAWL